MDSKDSDQTGRMHSHVVGFVERGLILTAFNNVSSAHYFALAPIVSRHGVYFPCQIFIFSC